MPRISHERTPTLFHAAAHMLVGVCVCAAAAGRVCVGGWVGGWVGVGVWARSPGTPSSSLFLRRQASKTGMVLSDDVSIPGVYTHTCNVHTHTLVVYTHMCV
jgi:hypothetical protein